MKIWTSILIAAIVVLSGCEIVFQGKALKASTVPTITSIGPVERAGNIGSRPAITTDSLNQPHIVVQGGLGQLYLTDRINGTWQETVFNLSSYTAPSSEINFPRTVIDKHNNRQWISGIMIYVGEIGGCGMGVITRSNVSTAPSGIYFLKSLVNDPSMIPLCMIDLDTAKTDIAYLYGNYGLWQEFGVNADGSIKTGSAGQKLITKNLGERNIYQFGISPADGNMWHSSYVGHPDLASVRYNGYMNSTMGSEVAWADPAIYPANDEDNYGGLCTDAKNSKAAYFAVYGGNGKIYVNVFNGSSMVYSKTKLLTMNADGGIKRYSPQWAPAKNGGAWLCWQFGGHIYVQYIGIDKVNGEAIDVAVGNTASIASDSKGDLHIVFMTGSDTKYVKCLVDSQMPIPATTLIAPVNATIKNPLDIKFSWAPVQEANKYRLTINWDDGGTNVYIDVWTTATSWMDNTNWAYGKYNWAVLTASNDVMGTWSTKALFTYTTNTVPPVTNLPAVVLNPIHATEIRDLSWQPIVGVDGYKFVLSMGSEIIVDKTLTSNVYEPDSLKDGSYTYYVQAVSNNAVGPITVGEFKTTRLSLVELVMEFIGRFWPF